MWISLHTGNVWDAEKFTAIFISAFARNVMRKETRICTLFIR